MTKTNNVFKDAYNRCLRHLEQSGEVPSEPEMGDLLKVSRTTIRAIMARLVEVGIVRSVKRERSLLRVPVAADYYPSGETSSLAEIIERNFMRRILVGQAEPGMQINELELAREIGAGTTSVREFLIRFSRFGLIEKRPNSHWILKGFNREFALELFDVREMFELRSAAICAGLDRGHVFWRELDQIEAEHHVQIADFENRYRDFSELDERFHLLIHKASNNRFILDFYDIIAFIFHYHYHWNKTKQRTRNYRALEEHLAYIAALKSGDVAAVERACRRHLESARETLLQSIPETSSPMISNNEIAQ